ncbi:MAG: SpoIIE family protein phosphatase [Fusobacteriota bacterium]
MEEKIVVIMRKCSFRNNIVITLQKKGYNVYIATTENKINYDIIDNLSPKLLLLGEMEGSRILQNIKKIKKNTEMEQSIITIIQDKFEQKKILNILKAGAMDIVYLKNDMINPLIRTVDKYLSSERPDPSLNLSESDSKIILTVNGGDLDIYKSSELKKRYLDVKKDFEDKMLIIDLREVENIKVAGLGVLLFIKNDLESENKNLKLIIDSPGIKQQLNRGRMKGYFDIEETIPVQNTKSTKIVIIDDARFMRQLIGNVLKDEGYETESFENPVLALEKLEQIDPDLIIVDYEMPKMNGLEFIEEFEPKKREIPVIMLTTVEDLDLAMNAIRMGASDFLNKPFKPANLLHVINKVVRENKLKKQNEELFKKIERRERELKKKNKKLLALNDELNNELELASELQKKIMIKGTPEIKGFDFATKYLPSRNIGGDFLDIIKMKNNYYGLIFSDISGHGIPAALLTTMFKVYFNMYTDEIISPSEAMEILNDEVEMNFPNGKFVSSFYMVIDEKTSEIKYCKAAQEAGILLKKDGSIEMLETQGQVLGLCSTDLFPEQRLFSEKTLNLKKGEKIILYTDGIIEAVNNEDEFYGLDRLKLLLHKKKDESANNLLDSIYEDLIVFLDGSPVTDDLTLMVIEKT